MKKFPAGKLPPEFFKQLLERYSIQDSSIVIGPQYGVDGAVVNLGGALYSIVSDPITFATKDLPYYLVGVNINDTVCMGAIPEYLIVDFFLPEGITDREVEELFERLNEVASRYSVKIIGGHTEVTYGITRVIAAGTMTGKVIKEIGPGKVEEGDKILLVKGIAIEGTSVIAREKSEELEGKIEGDVLEKAQNFLYEPGIIILEEALTALRNFDVHCMHDPTEGGIYSALYETLTAARKGAIINLESIPVYRETEIICNHFNIDPYGLLASGSLIIILPEKDALTLLEIYRKKNIPAEIIGEVKSFSFGIKLNKDGVLKELRPFERDEIVRVLG